DLLVREPGERVEPSRLVLLCQNEAGYKNLTRLVTRAYREGQVKGVATVDRSWLNTETTAGLIALSGAREGDVGRAIVGARYDDAREHLTHWLELFGDRYYLELQRTGRSGEEAYLRGAI